MQLSIYELIPHEHDGLPIKFHVKIIDRVFTGYCSYHGYDGWTFYPDKTDKILFGFFQEIMIDWIEIVD